MKSILLGLLAVLLFTGCYSKTPIIEIVEKRVDIVTIPDSVHFTYVNTPRLEIDLDEADVNIVLDELIKYIMKLQSTIYIYENKVDSLNEWKRDVEKIYDTK